MFDFRLNRKHLIKDDQYNVFVDKDTNKSTYTLKPHLMEWLLENQISFEVFAKRKEVEFTLTNGKNYSSYVLIPTIQFQSEEHLLLFALANK